MSLFYFVPRGVYGIIAFLNFAGTFGVIRAPDQSGQLAGFERPAIPLLVTAVVTVALLAAARTLLLTGGATACSSRVS